MESKLKSTCVRKDLSDSVDVVTLERSGIEEMFITVAPRRDADPFDMFDELTRVTKNRDFQILRQYVFGSCKLHAKGVVALNRIYPEREWPVTWVEDNAGSGELLTGTQACALRGGDIEPIVVDGRHVGCVFEDEFARHCLLGDIRPDNLSVSRSEQTREVLLKIEKSLDMAGMDFSNVMRTWFYLDNLLAWYDDFNAVRTKFFRERSVFEGIVPASTGIGAGNSVGVALVADVHAIQVKGGGVKLEAVGSPLQCPAVEYGSSFSRAVEISYPDHRRLYISGTASIDADGNSVNIGDTRRQIILTMDVIEGILESRRMGWGDVARAVAYFADITDAPLLSSYCRDAGIQHFPVSISHADICRDDLLFEMEVDALSAC